MSQRRQIIEIDSQFNKKPEQDMAIERSNKIVKYLYNKMLAHNKDSARKTSFENLIDVFINQKNVLLGIAAVESYIEYIQGSDFNFKTKIKKDIFNKKKQILELDGFGFSFGDRNIGEASIEKAKLILSENEIENDNMENLYIEAKSQSGASLVNILI